MRKFGAELLDILGGAEQEAGTASSRRSTGGGGGDEEDGIAALLLPLVDWGGMSTGEQGENRGLAKSDNWLRFWLNPRTGQSPRN